MEHLQSFITDCDRRTESAKKRLAETQEELSAEVAAKANKVHDLAEQIGKKLARAESLGADGMVEVSGRARPEGKLCEFFYGVGSVAFINFSLLPRPSPITRLGSFY